jgi:hypothetical protein
VVGNVGVTLPTGCGLDGLHEPPVTTGMYFADRALMRPKQNRGTE